MDVKVWLQQLGFEAYIDSFHDNEIDEEALITLTAEDLKDLGVSKIGHRRKLMNAIAVLAESENTDSIQTGINEPAMLQKAGSPQIEANSEAERRHLTVMFVDMVGSTELSTRVDAEEVREVITGFQNTVAGVVSRFEGFVARFMGDGVLCYFGWPRANEDDAERAVRAGLAIIDSVGKSNTPDGTPLATRVGIASGVVIVGDLIGSGASEEAAVVGETPNLAARLQSLAAPNQLVLPQATRVLLRNAFATLSTGLHALKGIAEPVEAFIVTAEASSESRFETRTTGSLTPLIGRHQEVEQVRTAWTQAVTGRGQMILFSGEAGIGKSRIVQTTIDDIINQQPHTRLTFQCSPYHTESAFYPIIHQMQYAAGFIASDSASQRLKKLKTLNGISEVNLPLLAAMLGIDQSAGYQLPALSPVQLRTRTLNALVETLVQQASDQPVLFVFEDLHWIDPTTLDFLDLVLDVIGDKRIFLLATTRPTFTHTFGGHPDVRRFALNRLEREQVLSIVEKLTGGKPIPEEVMQIIIDRTDGVPLFVEELTKTIIESGVVSEVENNYVLNGPLNDLVIPTTLHDSLMARLDRLQPVKEVAQTAACIGREFSHQLLSKVVTLNDEQLSEALTGLIDAELIFRRGVPPEARYQFKHALVRDAAYESLLTPKRHAIHAAILATLEKQPDTPPEVLATHAEAAGLIDKAIDLWESASKQAIARPAFDECITHLLHAIELLGPRLEKQDIDAEQRCLPLQIQLSVAYMSRRGWSADVTKASFERALELDNRIGESPMRFSILYGLSIARYTRGEHIEAVKHGQSFVDLAEASAETAPAVVANRSHATALFLFGEFMQAQPYYDRAITLFDPARHLNLAHQYGQDLGVGTFGVVSWNQLVLGKTQLASDYLSRCLDYAQSCDSTLSKCYALLTSVAYYFILNDYPEALTKNTREMIKLADEHELVLFQAFGDLTTAVLKLQQGDKSGLADFETSDARVNAIGTQFWRPYYRVCAMRHLVKMGMSKEAHEFGRVAKALIEKSNENFTLHEYHIVQAQLNLLDQDHEQAENNLLAALEISKEKGARLFHLRAAVQLAELWKKNGKDESIAHLLNEAKQGIEDGNCPDEMDRLNTLLQ